MGGRKSSSNGFGRRFSFRREAMHAQSPLYSDGGTFHAWQQPERQQCGQWQPYREMDPQLRLPHFFHKQHKWNDHVAYGKDREIGRGVIGALMVQGGSALGAGCHNTQIGLEYVPAPTSGAGFSEATPNGLLPAAMVDFVHERHSASQAQQYQSQHGRSGNLPQSA